MTIRSTPEKQNKRNTQLIYMLKRELFEKIYWDCIARLSYNDWQTAVNQIIDLSPIQIHGEILTWIEEDFWDMKVERRIQKAHEALNIFMQCCHKIEAEWYASDIEQSPGEEIGALMR